MQHNEPYVIERTFNAPAARVWKAITDKEQMKQWYFDMPAFKPEVGCEFTFTGMADKCVYVHLCKVTEVIPGEKLTYSWRYDGFEGISYVTFQLFEEGSVTRLVLTHTGLETFPASNAHFAKENFAGGWGYLIGTSLPAFLQKEETITA